MNILDHVSHRAGVVNDGEVGLSLVLLGRLRLDEAGGLAQVVVLQLLLEGLVGGLREHTLFLEDREHAHRLTHTGERSYNAHRLIHSVVFFIKLFTPSLQFVVCRF